MRNKLLRARGWHVVVRPSSDMVVQRRDAFVGSLLWFECVLPGGFGHKTEVLVR